ncbi:MAG: YcxB family protein [Opitutaceae bacterium]|nr:YcxB family protein [Opitutaceae bacterium]
MKIEVIIKKRDLVQLLLRAKVVTSSVKALFVVIFAVSIISSMSATLPELGGQDEISVYLILSCVIMGCVIALGMGILCTGFLCLCYVPYFFMLKNVPGILGHHVFTVEESGFREETEFGMMFMKWTAFKSVAINGYSIIISIGDLLYHVIPRRCFLNEEAYGEFYNSIKRHLEAAKKV